MILAVLVFVGLFLIGCTGGGSRTSQTYSVGGKVIDSDGNGIAGVLLYFGGGFGVAETDHDGHWNKMGLHGSVDITLEKDGWAFESKTVTKTDPNVNFLGQRTHLLIITITGEGTVEQELVVAPLGVYYDHQAQVKLTAVPDAGWRFSHWEGHLEGDENPATIVVDSGKSVVAVFVEAKYTLTINKIGLGSVSVTPNQSTYKYGDQVTLEATPNSDLAFSEWTGDLSGHSNPVSITVNDHMDITAVFVMSIQSAIDSAQDGDIIVVPPGRYYENLNLNGKNVTLTSEEPENPEIVALTVIDGGGIDAVIKIENGETNAIIRGFTITNGAGRLVNGVRHGGGIYIRDASATIVGNCIEGNSVSEASYRINQGGGLYVAGMLSSVTIKNNLFRNNYSGGSGGAIASSEGIDDISNNKIVDNSCDGGGGGIAISGGALPKISDNEILNNRAGGGGGGMSVYVPASSGQYISGNVISGNVCNWGGGGISLSANHNVRLNIVGNVISDNCSNSEGGGLHLGSGQHIISSNTISRNSSLKGGGIAGRGSHKFIDNIIAHNSSVEDGGGVYLYEGDPFSWRHDFSGNVFSRNNSQNNGGAVYLRNGYPTLLVGNMFDNNFAKKDGGAIWIGATSSLVDDNDDLLPKPDTFNTYEGNEPDDIFYE